MKIRDRLAGTGMVIRYNVGSGTEYPAMTRGGAAR